MSTSELRDSCDALAERDSEEEGRGLEGSGGRSAWEKRREAAKRSSAAPSSVVGREGLERAATFRGDSRLGEEGVEVSRRREEGEGV